MKKMIGIGAMVLVLLCGCSNNGTTEKKEEEPKINEVQQKDIDIAQKLTTAAENMGKLESFHIVAQTEGGDVYDLNMSGDNYAGTQKHMISVNGVEQEATDYVYEKDGKQASYFSYSGKILPQSNNFGPYMISNMQVNANSYKDRVPAVQQEDYQSIFEVKDLDNGSISIKPLEDKKTEYVLNKDLYVVEYTNKLEQTFKADNFNNATLDYSNSGF